MRVCSVCFPPQPHPPEIPTHNPQPPSTRDPHPQPLSTRDSHPQPHPRILFTDFSSAYNAIQPHILANKLVSYFSLDNHLVLWIIDFLTNRLQRVFVNGCFSELSLTCTGSPQGCVPSPLLFILYTDECRSNHLNRFLVKFADDSALLSLLHGSEQYHGPALTEFAD